MTLVHALPTKTFNAPTHMKADLNAARVDFNLFTYFGGFAVQAISNVRKPDLIVMDVTYLPEYRYHTAVPDAIKAIPHLIIDAYPDSRGLKKYTEMAQSSAVNVIGQVDINDLSQGQHSYFTIPSKTPSRLSKLLAALDKEKSITAQAFAAVASNIPATAHNTNESIVQKQTREYMAQNHMRYRRA